MNKSRNTNNEFVVGSGLLVNIKDIYGEGFSFPNCTDGIVVLTLSNLDPRKSSSYISKCMALAGKDKRFVIYRRILQEWCYHFANQDKEIKMGSMSDGSDTLESDHDTLRILNTMVKMLNVKKLDASSSACLLADLSCTPPGFTKLFSISKQSYLSNSYIQSMDQLPKTIQSARVGPSYVMKTIENSLIGDLVYAIPCSDWPLFYRDRWLNRSRPFGWPPKLVVEDLSKTSCFVVPVGREDSTDSHLEWRFVFPYVERGLVWAFNTIQLQCFVLLKIFNNVFFKKFDDLNDGISSFHIKMVMFWECEESDPNHWSEENLFDCVRRCLRRLRLAIKQKELKHFIIEERNVLVTKLKAPETREKLLKEIQTLENDISGSMLKSLLEGENFFLKLEMIHFQYFLQKSRTSLDLDFNKMMCNRLAWIDQRNHFVITSEIVFHLLFELLNVEHTSNKKNISILRKMKNDINLESIPHKTISHFMKDIHLISSGKVCHKVIEQILLQVSRFLNAFIDIQVGSRLLKGAAKIQGPKKEKMIMDAEICFKKGVEMDDMAGQLYLVTYYLACGKDKSAENKLTSLLKENGVLVSEGTGNLLSDAILISDGNVKLTTGISQDFSQRGYASFMVFSDDFELVPDVLKYELCMLLKGEELLVIHPFVYAKYLLIHFSIKSKSGKVTKYIEELRQSLTTMFQPTPPIASQHFNILAYCYRQIGATSEAIYNYMRSVTCLSNTPIRKSSGMFHLAFLLNQVLKAKTEAMEQTSHKT